MDIQNILYYIRKKVSKNIENLSSKDKILTLDSILNSNELKKKGCAVLAFFMVLNMFSANMAKESKRKKGTDKEPYTTQETIKPEDLELYHYMTNLSRFDAFRKSIKLINHNGDSPMFKNDDELMPFAVDSVAYDESEPTEEPVEEPYVITTDDKIMAICEAFNLTIEQFNVIKGVVIAEAQAYSYEDAYAVINTIYNRSICSRWIYDVDKHQGEGLGSNMYNQVIQQGQFDPYWYTGSYIDYVDATDLEQPAVAAIVDFFCGIDPVVVDGKIQILPHRLHDCVNFVGYKISHKYNAKSYTERGNQYGVHMKDDEYVTDQFTSISEEEVEKRASEAEAYSQECRSYLEQGKNEEEIMQLMLTKTDSETAFY